MDVIVGDGHHGTDTAAVVRNIHAQVASRRVVDMEAGSSRNDYRTGVMAGHNHSQNGIHHLEDTSRIRRQARSTWIFAIFPCLENAVQAASSRLERLIEQDFPYLNAVLL